MACLDSDDPMGPCVGHRCRIPVYWIEPTGIAGEPLQMADEMIRKVVLFRERLLIARSRHKFYAD